MFKFFTDKKMALMEYWGDIINLIGYLVSSSIRCQN